MTYTRKGEYMMVIDKELDEELYDDEGTQRINMNLLKRLIKQVDNEAKQKNIKDRTQMFTIILTERYSGK